MIRWRIPCSVPRLLPRLRRCRSRSSGLSSAESSVPSGVTSGGGSSGTSVGAAITIRKRQPADQPGYPRIREPVERVSTSFPQTDALSRAPQPNRTLLRQPCRAPRLGRRSVACPPRSGAARAAKPLALEKDEIARAHTPPDGRRVRNEPAVQLRSPRNRSAGSFVPPWRKGHSARRHESVRTL
jgi:hypothetical protein